MNQSAYFDLEDVWVNELFGDVWIFTFVGLGMIWYFSIKAKLPYHIPILLSVIWCAICFSIAYSQLIILWIIALLMVGFLFYYGISKLMSR